MEKRLTTFTGSINIISSLGPKNPVISGLNYDSRRVRRGDLFFALPGTHTDGRKFITAAVENGAAAVVLEGKPPTPIEGISYLIVGDARTAMSRAAAEFYGHPSRKLSTIGVTGTDGKSSTVFFIHQLLQACGHSSGFLSTVSFDTGGGGGQNYLRQSTPEAAEIQALLAEMTNNGLQYAVVEATSHGLSDKTRRLQDVSFDTAVITNISHEHLEFHGSFAQYKMDKASLFRRLTERNSEPAVAVINLDDPEAGYFTSAAKQGGAKIYSYSMTPHALPGCHIESCREGPDSIEFTLCCRQTEGGPPVELRGSLPMVGRFNLENLMAAFLAVVSRGDCNPQRVIAAASTLQPVEGRMNLVRMGQPFTVIVDYAHTPGSFTKILPLLADRTEGRLISVFGSAGERDVEKRPIQGSIAEKYCDFIILADEDPRGEDPMAILGDIAAGMENKTENRDLFLIPDRRQAIAKACSLAAPGDTVVLLGKGHEKSIIYPDGPVNWNESAEAEACLRSMGWTGAE